MELRTEPTVRPLLYKGQSLDLKVSPDMDEKGVNDILRVLLEFEVGRVIVANTTTRYDTRYIDSSIGKGGASGNAVYDASLKTQILFNRLKKKQKCFFEIVACGGINSYERLAERVYFGASEVQLYTPLIFSGTRLLRDLRKGKKT